MWLLLASAALAGDIYRYVTDDGTWVITDSPQHAGFDLIWDDPDPGSFLPNGVPMPRLDRIANLDSYDEAFLGAGARNGVPAELLKAMAVVESRMNPGAVSPAGAQGLMQLMPGTARTLGVSDPFDATQSIDGGAAFVADQLARFGDTRLAVAAYNAGPGAVARAGGVPPIAETRTYVDRVLGLYALFRDTRPLRN
jgi:soluble lytic murein transglycosylase-like protein